MSGLLGSTTTDEKQHLVGFVNYRVCIPDIRD